MNSVHSTLKIMLLLTMSISMGWSLAFDPSGANCNDYDYSTPTGEDTDYVATTMKANVDIVISEVTQKY